jgi:hypothetical protein
MKFRTEIDHKHTYRLHMKHCKSAIKNMVTTQNYEFSSDKFNIESVLEQ